MNIRSVLIFVLLLASCKSTELPDEITDSDCLLISGNDVYVDSIVLASDMAPMSVDIGNNTTAVDRTLADLNSTFAYRVDCEGRLVSELVGSWEKRGSVWVLTPRGSSPDEKTKLARAIRMAWPKVANDLPYTNLDIDAEGNLLLTMSQPGNVPPTMLTENEYGLPDHSGQAVLNRPSLTVQDVEGGNLRNLLNSGLDLLVTDDMDLVDFASGQENLQVTDLPPDRIYAFISVTRSEGEPVAMAAAPLDLTSAISSGTPAALEDAWWMSNMDCMLTPDSVDTVAAVATQYYKIAYPSGDAIAQGLAERLIALPQIGILDSSYTNQFIDSIPGFRERRRLLKTEALDAQKFAAALKTGNAFGYVVALPAAGDNKCGYVEKLAEAADWLSPTTVDLSVIPLLHSKPYLIAGQRVPSIARDDQNRLFFVTEVSNNP